MFQDNLKHCNLNIFFILTHVLLEISSGGILELGDFVRGAGGGGGGAAVILGGYCPGDIVRGDIVLILGMSSLSTSEGKSLLFNLQIK